MHIFGEPVEQFVKQLQSEDKSFTWAPYSGHAFHPLDTKKNEQILINQIKYIK